MEESDLRAREWVNTVGAGTLAHDVALLAGDREVVGLVQRKIRRRGPCQVSRGMTWSTVSGQPRMRQ